MTVMIVNYEELRSAIDVELKRVPHDVLQTVQRTVQPGRLEQLAFWHMFLTDPGTAPHKRSSLKTICRPWLQPCSRAKHEAEWVHRERSKGTRLVRFNQARSSEFRATLNELIEELAAIARISESQHAGIARRARKFLKGKSVIEPDRRSAMLAQLEDQQRRDEVKARMNDTAVVPEPMILHGLSFSAMDSPAAIDALGSEAGNCLRRRFNGGDRFYAAAEGLLRGTTHVWAVRSGATLLAVIEVDTLEAHIREIKGLSNAAPPHFMVEALYEFVTRLNLRAQGADCASMGLIQALVDRDRTRPDAVIWDRDKAYRVWIDARHVVICGRRKHAVLRAPARVPTMPGRIARALMRRACTMSEERSMQLLAVLLEHEAGAHPMVRSIAAHAMALLSTEEHGKDGYGDPYSEIDED